MSRVETRYKAVFEVSRVSLTQDVDLLVFMWVAFWLCVAAEACSLCPNLRQFKTCASWERRLTIVKSRTYVGGKRLFGCFYSPSAVVVAIKIMLGITGDLNNLTFFIQVGEIQENEIDNHQAQGGYVIVKGLDGSNCR